MMPASGPAIVGGVEGPVARLTRPANDPAPLVHVYVPEATYQIWHKRKGPLGRGPFVYACTALTSTG